MAKFYFRYGAMGSGKTIDLLKVAYNYKERGKNVLIYTAKIDDRYEVGKITTRIGIQSDALLFDSETNIYRDIKKLETKPDCILVDEAQFLTRKQVIQLSDIVDFLDIPVICYGLRTNFKMKFFEGSGPLMEYADKIEEIKTICECGKKATVNMRMINGVPVTTGPDILIGGNDSYKAVCRKCYKKLTHHVAGI